MVTECDFEGVGLGVGRGFVVSAPPMNGILVSESFGFALFDGFAEGLPLAGCAEERLAALMDDTVDEAVVTDGSGATDGLSTLNCGGAPPS